MIGGYGGAHQWSQHLRGRGRQIFENSRPTWCTHQVTGLSWLQSEALSQENKINFKWLWHHDLFSVFKPAGAGSGWECGPCICVLGIPTYTPLYLCRKHHLSHGTSLVGSYKKNHFQLSKSHIQGKGNAVLRSVHWDERFDLEPLREDGRKAGGEYPPDLTTDHSTVLWENKATRGLSSHAPRHGYPGKLTNHNSENQLSLIRSQLSGKYWGI